MKCFQHTTADALGICRTCGKGICGTCARDLGFGIVCSDHCAALATAQHQMSERAAQIYRIGGAKQRIPTATMFMGLFGILFTGFGIWDLHNGNAAWIPLIMGVGFLVFSGITYLRARKLGLNL